MDRTCEDQQAAYLDGDTDAAVHLDGCAVCVLEKSGLDEVKAVLDDEATWIEPPADLERRVVAATRGDDLGARREQRIARSGTGAGRGGRRLLWIAAAACVLGAVVGAGVVKALDQPAGFPQQVALAGTALQPGASATAHLRTTPNGVEIHLDVTGLPTTPAGSFYEAWLKGPSGLVPIGSFHTGNGQITLWSGVSIATHPTITVTIQSDNGDSTSSGKQVLVGTIKP